MFLLGCGQQQGPAVCCATAGLCLHLAQAHLLGLHCKDGAKAKKSFIFGTVSRLEKFSDPKWVLAEMRVSSV